MPGGLVLFSTGGVQQLTGGSSGVNNPLAVTPTSAVVVPQSYYGCSANVRPIPINYDLIYVHESTVIDLSYNFFANIYTGSDISLLSSHLFDPHVIIDWAYQEIPFKVIWALRDDSVLLSLTYLKEQEVYGWARHDTFSGSIVAVASVREGTTDGVYFLVQRGASFFVERLCGRDYTGGIQAAWCLDSAVYYTGMPITHITGLSHLNGLIVFALADGVKQGPFTVVGGSIDLSGPASNVLVGLAIQAQLQTLYLDIGGEAGTIQGKRKRITAMSTRVKDTAGLKIGTTFSTLAPFVVGRSSTDPINQTNGLILGDMRMLLDANYSVTGQVCIQQDDPYPATVLGVIPEITLGDK